MLDGSFTELMGQEGQADYGRERLLTASKSGAARGRNLSWEQVASPACWRWEGARCLEMGVKGSGNQSCCGAPVKGPSWQG